MSDAPKTDWDMVHQWEWFRRPRWQHDFRQTEREKNGGVYRAFSELCSVINAQSALDSACGLGKSTILLSDMGLNILGCDGSPVAVEHARELARNENSNATFFDARWETLPGDIPHPFDAILNTSLVRIPEWEMLGAAFGGFFHALKPGGFLMFAGPGENDPEDCLQQSQNEEWENTPEETAEWNHRDGATFCACVKQKSKGENYIDERTMYIVGKGEESSITSTTRRIPGYWNWSHFAELTRAAGFCHLETREYEGYGPNGSTLRLNVAWKAKNDSNTPDHETRNAPYKD